MVVFFIGVDGEMSHDDVSAGGALLQLGVAVRGVDGVMQHFDTVMRPGGEYAWDDVAASVHGFTREQVDSWDVSVGEADKMLYDWLVGVGCKPSKRSDNVAVGFSVGSFDMPFVKRFLPDTFSLFTRRFLDLNALVYMLAVKTGEEFLSVKTHVMDEVVERIGYNKAHDAGWDAIMSVVFMEVVEERLKVSDI